MRHLQQFRLSGLNVEWNGREVEDHNCCCYQGTNKDLSQSLVPWNKVWGGKEEVGRAGNSGNWTLWAAGPYVA